MEVGQSPLSEFILIDKFSTCVTKYLFKKMQTFAQIPTQKLK